MYFICNSRVQKWHISNGFVFVHHEWLSLSTIYDLSKSQLEPTKCQRIFCYSSLTDSLTEA